MCVYVLFEQPLSRLHSSQECERSHIIIYRFTGQINRPDWYVSWTRHVIHTVGENPKPREMSGTGPTRTHLRTHMSTHAQQQMSWGGMTHNINYSPKSFLLLGYMWIASPHYLLVANSCQSVTIRRRVRAERRMQFLAASAGAEVYKLPRYPVTHQAPGRWGDVTAIANFAGRFLGR